MTLIFVLIPFAIAFLLIYVIKTILIANKNTAPIDIVNVNNCANTAIPPAIFNKVNNMNSIPNKPFRPDLSSTYLEYLCNQETDDGCKTENTILTCLGGRL
ncbi:MAG: hypothetical protein LBK66_13060 [Spirochaetaceae bacterium]|jgi:hypothetical protein|nr:hypothetical protein [Spirochaetaceae bacterium]